MRVRLWALRPARRRGQGVRALPAVMPPPDHEHVGVLQYTPSNDGVLPILGAASASRPVTFVHGRC